MAAAYRKCICGNACSYYMARCDHCQEWYYMSCHKLTEKAIEDLKGFYCKPCKRKNRTLQDTRRLHPTDKVATYERRQCDDDTPHAVHRFQGRQEKARCICKTPCKTSFIQCAGEKCKRWCHTECISYTEEMADFVSKYYCPPCVEQDPRLMIAFHTPSPPPPVQPHVPGSSRKRAASSIPTISRGTAARGGRDTSAATSALRVSSSTDRCGATQAQMFDDETDTTTSPEELAERDESWESGADDYDEDDEEDNGGVYEGRAKGEHSVSAPSNPKKRKLKRRKSSKKGKPSGRDYLPDPYKLNSQECCDQMGMTNVDFPYSEEDYETITSATGYNALFRPVLQKANPEANYSRLLVVLTAKYREYQAHLAELGRTLPKKPALRRSSKESATSSIRGGRETSVTSSTHMRNARIFPGLGARYPKRRPTAPHEAAPHRRERRGGYDDSGSPCTPTTTTDIHAAAIPESSPMPQHKQEEPQEYDGTADGMDLGGPGADNEPAQGHPTAEPLTNGGSALAVQVKQEEPDAGTDEAPLQSQTRIQQLEEQLRNKDRMLGNAKEGNRRLLETRRRLEEELATSNADYTRLSEGRKRDADAFARALAEKELEIAEVRRQLAAANHQQPSTSASGNSDATLLARIRDLENELQLRDAYIAKKTLEAQGIGE